MQGCVDNLLKRDFVNSCEIESPTVSTPAITIKDADVDHWSSWTRINCDKKGVVLTGELEVEHRRALFRAFLSLDLLCEHQESRMRREGKYQN